MTRILDNSSEVLIRVAGMVFVAGLGWGAAAVLLVYVLSRYLPPQLPRGEVWTHWRRKRMVWALVLTGSAAGAFLTTGRVTTWAARDSLFWLLQLPLLLPISHLGMCTGFLVVPGIVTLAGALHRRRAARAHSLHKPQT